MIGDPKEASGRCAGAAQPDYTDVANIADMDIAHIWAGHMDAAISDVFETMLARGCTAIAEQPELRNGFAHGLAARVTLSGALELQCVVEFAQPSAQNLAAAFLGAPDETSSPDDALLADALGEFCNMIAGGWKKRLGEPAWSASLSVPTVMRSAAADSAATLPNRTGRTDRLRRAYAFDGGEFLVRLTAP